MGPTVEDGVVYQLSNCELMRLDVDDDHYYYGGKPGQIKQYFLSVTKVLDIAAPFPEGLRQYLRVTSYEEQKERLEMTAQRGTKLHDGLDKLVSGEPLNLKEYPTIYEKAALTTFVRLMRFLLPDPRTKRETELIVADPKLRIAGTLDFKGHVEAWKVKMLLEPNKYLYMDTDGDIGVKDEWIDLVDKKSQNIIIDWKFTGRNSYNHKVQAAAYKTMNNLSRQGRKVSRAFIWRYSPRHKFGFDFQESLFDYKSFKRIYDTAIDYLGEFPEPPTIRRYPDSVRLYEPIIKEDIDG